MARHLDRAKAALMKKKPQETEPARRPLTGNWQ